MSRYDPNRDRKFPKERIFWEIERALYSFKDGTLLGILLMQAAAFIFVQAKGAGRIYLDMSGILFGITLLSWFFTTIARGNRRILIYALILLTVGTMLQSIFKEEQILKNPQYYETHNPAAALQLQYILGMAAALIAAGIYRSCRKLASLKVCRWLFCFALLLSLVTLVLAKSVGNAKNWLSIGGISLQTTELVKLCYVFVAAGLLGTREAPRRSDIAAFYLVTAAEVLLLTAQSEFGTMLLILLTFLMFAFLFIPDLRYFAATVVAMAAGSGVLVLLGSRLSAWKAAGSVLGTNRLARLFLANYEKIANRFIYWLHPEKDALGLGYQLLKAKESIVLGGWLGTSSVTELPVKTSDLVYPALIQRCGMLFALLVFMVFILLWLESVRAFIRKKDRYHRAVGAGFSFMFFDQTLIIIAGSTGLCPLTGITLPFISSGGTSLVVSFVMVGILIAVSGNVRWKGVREDEETDQFFAKNASLAKCHAHLRHLNDRLARAHLGTPARRFRGGRSAKERGEDEGL